LKAALAEAAAHMRGEHVPGLRVHYIDEAGKKTTAVE
jgi:hypothetical protein